MKSGPAYAYLIKVPSPIPFNVCTQLPTHPEWLCERLKVILDVVCDADSISGIYLNPSGRLGGVLVAFSTASSARVANTTSCWKVVMRVARTPPRWPQM